LAALFTLHFAQDGNENYEPIEIIHLDADTAFTGLAFNNDGTILAISDNVSGLRFGWRCWRADMFLFFLLLLLTLFCQCFLCPVLFFPCSIKM